jgi:hypothetical protein
MDVEHRAIEGWPGYRIGDDGKPQSCWSIGGRRRWLTEQWHDLAPYIDKQGRPKITLHRGHEQKTFSVYRLVLEAFVGPCPPGMESCHDPDPNPANCRLVNLRWDTHTANLEDLERHGRRIRGSRHSLAKLTEAAVIEIRRAYAAGEANQCQLAERHGVRQTSISMILTRTTWRHI